MSVAPSWSAVLAVLMSLMMALAPVAGTAPAEAAPVSVELSAELNVENLQTVARSFGGEIGEDDFAKLSLIADILDVLRFSAVYDGAGAAQLNVFANDSTLLNAAVRVNEGGVSAVSNLLGNYVLTLSADAVNTAMQQSETETPDVASAISALQGIDLNADELLTAAFGAIDDMTEQVSGRVTSWESGLYELEDGYTFTRKGMTDITDTEFQIMFLTAVKTALAETNLPAAMASISPEADLLASIDEQIARTSEAPASEMVYEIAYYDNDAGDLYVCFDGTEAFADVHVAFGTVGGRHCLEEAQYTHISEEQLGYSISASMEIAFSAAAANDLAISLTSGTSMRVEQLSSSSVQTVACSISPDNGILISAETAKDNLTAHLTAAIAADQPRNPVSVLITMNDASGEPLPVLTVEGEWGVGGEITAVFEGENVQILSADAALTDETAAQELANLLNQRLMTRALIVGSTLIAALPPESAEMLTTLLYQR